MRMLFAALAAVVLAAPTFAESMTLTGENTKVTFVGTKPDGKHEGGFKTVTGTASMTGTDIATLKIEVEFDMDSIFSDNDKLTQHLKAPDFFAVKDYPKAKFVTSSVAKADDGYTVTGNLTIKGKTESVSFVAKITAEAGKLKLTSDAKIDRTKFNMEYGKGKIDDVVALKIAVDAK